MMVRLMALLPMQHLDPERLAALHEEQPTPEERAHLAVCAECRRERDAFDALADLAISEGTRGRPDVVQIDAVPMAPLTQWELLRPRLIDEGLLTSGSLEHVAPGRAIVGTRTRRWIPRMAAAVALVASGAALGRVTAPSAESASGALSASETNFTTAADAQAALLRAQSMYDSASAWLAVHDTTMRSSDVYRARLAALDDMLSTSREALRAAPTDPVLNQYYLNASTARETTLRQLGGVLPVSQSIDSY
jgi:hypothetical protein